MPKNKIIMIVITLIIILTIFLANYYTRNNVKQIYIGYQSVTSQTWGALIMKNQKIFEKKLQEYYPDKTIEVIWYDEISGAVINTCMIFNKCHFGFMGDMPLLLNMNQAATRQNYDSALLAFDGKGIKGRNQSIMVPHDSDMKKIADLKGKTISTPIGSSAHFMLLRVLEKYDLLDDVNIVHQDVALASQLLITGQTDAFSIWAPYPNFLADQGYGKELVAGEKSQIDYQAGVIVNRNWAQNNEKIVELFLESLAEAHTFIKNNPQKAADIFTSESGFSINVTQKEVNNITWDSSISAQDIATLAEKKQFLIDLEKINNFILNKFLYEKRGE